MSVDPRADYYQILGVQQDASDDAIKKAYRKLAKQYHPDRTGGDKAKEARFKEISQAYDVIGDKDRRAQYDAVRSGGIPFGAAGGAGGGVDLGDLFASLFNGGAGGGRASDFGRDGNVHFSYSTGGDGGIFDGLFGKQPFAEASPRRRRRTERPPEKEKVVLASDGSKLLQRGADVYSEVRLALDEAVLGAVKDVSTLGGKASVKIPPATSSGKRLRLRGKGVPKHDGSRGDHYVTVQIDIPRASTDKAKRALHEFMKYVR